MSDPEPLVSDLLIAIEDLLVRAQQLVTVGAPTAAIEAILVEIDALRGGTG